MMFNRKGQSILENVITVTLVTLGIVLSWDLSSQLTGGGIKNLVSMPEEPDPHKYIKQAPPGGGISIPGCDCTDWFPPLHLPGACVPGGCNGDPLSAQHTRTCSPAGCESTVFPPLQTLICANDNPMCCTTPTLFPGGVPASCGVNAVCPSPATPGCFTDGRCPDGTGLYRHECQFSGNYLFTCAGFSGCFFSCQNGASRPLNTDICPSDTTRLPNNLVPWTIAGQSVTNCSNPPGSPPKCQTHCTTGSTYNTGTGQCDLQVCGNGSIEGTEVCDHGASGEFNPLALTCSGNGGSGRREQKMFCPQPPYGNCDRVGYRYYMRDFTNPPAHSPNYSLYYSFNTARFNNNQRVQFSCPAGKRIRLWDVHHIDGSTVNIHNPSSVPTCSGAVTATEQKMCEAGAMIAFNIATNQPSGSWPVSADGYSNAVIGCPNSSGATHNNIGFICEPPGRYDCFAMPYITQQSGVVQSGALAGVHGHTTTATCPSGYYVAFGGLSYTGQGYATEGTPNERGFVLCCSNNPPGFGYVMNRHTGANSQTRNCNTGSLTNVTFPITDPSRCSLNSPLCRLMTNLPTSSGCEPVANGLYHHVALSYTTASGASTRLCCATNYIRLPQNTVHSVPIPDLRVNIKNQSLFAGGVERMPSCPPPGFPTYTQITWRYCQGNCDGNDSYIAVCNQP